MMRVLMFAAALLCLGGGSVAAQDAAGDIAARLAGHAMDLREADVPDAPVLLRAEMFDTGAARLTRPGEAPEWGIWRVSEEGRFCTMRARLTEQNQLIATTEEDCLDLSIEGDLVSLVFRAPTGEAQVFSGRLIPQ